MYNLTVTELYELESCKLIESITYILILTIKEQKRNNKQKITQDTLKHFNTYYFYNLVIRTFNMFWVIFPLFYLLIYY